MNYLNHTLKACGPLALALVLSACGEKNDLAEAASDTAAADSAAAQTELSGDRRANRLANQPTAQSPSPAQSTVTQEFSPPEPVAQVVAVQPAPAPVAGTDTPILAAIDTPVDAPANAPVSAPVDTGRESPAQPVEVGGDPLVTLIARTNSSLNGSGTQLEWSTENVDECQTSGAWDGAVETAGVVNLSHEASGEHTYMISCRGALGTAMAMVTITVESTALVWEAPGRNTDGSALTDLAGYNLYYGTEPGRYTQVRAVRDASQTELELPVEPGTYYMALTAYDMSGNESELSNEITRIIN